MVRDTQGRFLVLHTTKQGRNRWEFPGGAVDAGEDITTAAVREFREEVGITIYEPLEFVREDTLFIDGDNWEASFLYASNWVGTPTVMEPDKSAEVRWVNLEEMAQLPQIPFLLLDVARKFSGYYMYGACDGL